MPDATLSALPRWRSHKIVSGDKITGISTDNGIERWHLACGAVIEVNDMLRNRVPGGAFPVGGYLVVYEDGFRSWSPAEAFEGGYTRIED